VYGIEFTAIRSGVLNSNRIKDYNVIILPDGSSAESRAKRLKDWVSDGGTLVMIKGAAASATKKSMEFTTSSLVTDLRKKDGEASENLPSKEGAKPEAKPQPVEVSLEFKPSHIPGAILRAKLDQTHFLSYGYGEFVNVIMNSSSMFLPSRNGHNVATFADKENLCVSGLVWEDMLEALPGKAYLIDERVGQGHIILYADDPNFRAYWDGLDRLFFNSILFGPSLGR